MSGIDCNGRLLVYSPSPSLCAGPICVVVVGGLLHCLSGQGVSVPRGEAPRLESPRRTFPSLRAPGLPSPYCASAPSPCTRTFCNDRRLRFHHRHKKQVDLENTPGHGYKLATSQLM
ncbi:uncharacterized protein LOC107466229 [Arachis duranensis]|uniref:Uncharacterized protein LOC107466229 n=1 Tax=Arachis duranensis TaxID=130453 RepID=A0A9C6TGC7_ARADU|nr:uncharacterized protein LOC107466229 [Arachis duranensis]